MKVIETSLPGVLLLEPKVFGDKRGFFLETYQAERYKQSGVTASFIQDNHSHSTRGVLRGMHFQLEHAQAKLVSVVRGEVFDVAVDVRRGSPHFGKWCGAVLNEDNHHQLYIPEGFAHGFCVLSDEVDFMYKCTDYYHPEDEVGFAWDDPEVGIEWPVSNPVLSDKDTKLYRLSELAEDKLPLYTGN